MIRSQLAAAAILGLSAGLSPGPLLTLVVSETLKRGVAGGIRVAVAPLITDLPIILAAVFLLARLSDQTFILGAISLAGGGIMAWMGYESMIFQGADAGPPGVGLSSLTKGILANFLNPSPYLFWLTIGTPLLMETAARSLPLAAVFILIFYGCLVGSKIGTAVAVGKSKHFLSSRTYVASMKILGLLLVAFAIQFFWKGIHYFR
ncbi:MAG: LysE family translocator [Desulfobacterales bacterium]